MIPDYQSLMRPVLSLVSDTEELRSRDVKDALADLLELTAKERAETLPSGRQRTIDSRVGWALTYLAQSGLVERPRRGMVRITAAGRTALQENPERIDVRVLEKYPEFREFRVRSRTTQPDSDGVASPSKAVSATPPQREDDTPSELVERAVRINRAALESEVLAAALKLSPYAFEGLVMRLLGAMGYGHGQEGLERTQASGDAGVDGIISQDPLGLDRIYVQAKRYAEDRPIDRPRIHEFAGALMGKQGDRGVFITTSRFTDGACQEAEKISARIELIDGQKLSRLLIAHGVGVQTESIAQLYRLDEDYFEGL